MSKILREQKLFPLVLLHWDGNFCDTFLVATCRPVFAVTTVTDPLFAIADNGLPPVLML